MERPWVTMLPAMQGAGEKGYKRVSSWCLFHQINSYGTSLGDDAATYGIRLHASCSHRQAQLIKGSYITSATITAYEL